MSRVERWERRSEVPLLLLAVAFLVAYAWPVLDPRLDRGWRDVLTAVSWTVWVAFAVDFLVRLRLADDRRSYAVRHWYDVALIAVPMLRPLRLLRLVTLLRFLDRSAGGTLAGRGLAYAAETGRGGPVRPSPTWATRRGRARSGVTAMSAPRRVTPDLQLPAG